jgi:ComF family protein
VTVLDILFPPVCLGCERLVHPGDDLPLCSACRPDHQPLPPTPPDRNAALCSYEGPVRRALVRLKFHRDIAWAGPLGAALARAAHLHAEFDHIVPVPLHRTRLWRRGFNQTELLLRAAARVVGPDLRRRLRPRLLVRHRRTRPQTSLPAAERRTNVAGAFSLRRPIALEGARILLVDDIVTTGSTLRAAAAPLERAGARVVVLALMRADP